MTEAAPEIQALLIAALIGLLVGLERERKRERTGTIFAGIRTFPLLALFGAIVGLLTVTYGPLIFFGGTLAVAVLVGLSYWRISQGPKLGGTTEAAVLVVYGLGVLTGHGHFIAGLAGAVAVTALLSLREELHEFAFGLSRADLFAVVQFAAITLIVLPLLPDTRIGPWGVWNPRELWLLVVLISGTSFLGYAAGKIVGPGRGALLGGALGGLASSTAVTVAHARRARRDPQLAGPLALGALAANIVMALRAFVILVVVAPELAVRLLVPALALVIVAAIAILVLEGQLLRTKADAAARAPEADGDVDEAGASSAQVDARISNPVELRTALLFTAFFAALLLAVEAARSFLGEGAFLATAALAGTTHLDAATLSVAQQLERGVGLPLAGVAVTFALAANVVVKAALALISRNGRFVAAVGGPLLVAAAGVLATLWIPLD